MPPTDHHDNRPTRSPNATAAGRTAPVVPMPRGSRSQDQRLQDYLNRRDAAGTEVSCRMSHGLDHGEQLIELMTLEMALSHCWPHVYRARTDRWLQRDAALIHDPSRPLPECRYCETDAGESSATADASAA